MFSAGFSLLTATIRGYGSREECNVYSSTVQLLGNISNTLSKSNKSRGDRFSHLEKKRMTEEKDAHCERTNVKTRVISGNKVNASI